MNTIISKSLIETEEVAKQWLDNLPAPKHKATVVDLNGQLGSGKTTFTQAVARALGITENITSPTFVLMKIYEISTTGNAGAVNKFKHLVHIDAYRLEEGSQLSALNFEQINSDPSNLVLIEWAENVKSGLPETISHVEFEHVGENERKITLN